MSSDFQKKLHEALENNHKIKLLEFIEQYYGKQEDDSEKTGGEDDRT